MCGVLSARAELSRWLKKKQTGGGAIWTGTKRVLGLTGEAKLPV